MKPRLFHVSEDPAIRVFEPRPAPNPDAGVRGLAVWAVDEAHLPNYLLPRDCPRVTFAAAENTTPADRARFLPATSARVVAVEAAWLPRISACELHLYELPEHGFVCVDAGAGYHISRTVVTPSSVRKVPNLLAELRTRGAELRVLPSLWELRDAVAASSLEFSIIRFRNAAPRSSSTKGPAENS